MTETSHFVANRHIDSTLVPQGGVLLVRWAPDRCCHFCHRGLGHYEVLQSENSKLAVGDTFECAAFIVGMPAYLDRLTHQGSEPSLYIIGKQGGLTEASLIATGVQAGVVEDLSYLENYVRQRIPRQPILLTAEGRKKEAVPLVRALSNALKAGILTYDGQQLALPANRTELECGFIVHKLKEFYTFASWSEVENLIVRRKHDGTTVKSLRQLRSFSPHDRSGREEPILKAVFLSA